MGYIETAEDVPLSKEVRLFINTASLKHRCKPNKAVIIKTVVEAPNIPSPPSEQPHPYV
jgi:hypothetical protein